MVAGLLGAGLLASPASAQFGITIDAPASGPVCSSNGGLYVDSSGSCNGFGVGDTPTGGGGAVLGNVFSQGVVESHLTQTNAITPNNLNDTITQFGSIQLGIPSPNSNFTPTSSEFGFNSDDKLNVKATTTFNAPTTFNGPANFTNLLTAAGGIDVTSGNVKGNGTNTISDFASVSAGTGNFTTVNSTTIENSGNVKTATLETTGLATLNSLSVTNNATVGGTLEVSGLTTTNGIQNTGNFTTDTASVNGTLGVAGLTTTNGIQNTGNITTDTASVNGTLAVAGLTTTNGIQNTGNITTDTASVNGTLAVAGLTTTNGIQNTGNVTTDTANVKGTLNVGGQTTTNGIQNTGHIQTTTLSTTGDASIGGNLDMTGGRITNLADPINPLDAANKQYVDVGLAKAFKEIDRNTQGIAIAMAMAGLTLPEGKSFALGANMGFFDDKQAVAIQAAIRLSPNLTLTGGFGTGVQDLNTTGGRVGIQAAW
jgi:hypothetical protein